MHPFLASFADELIKVGAAKPLASRLTPESSNVRGYSYDPGSKALTVTYKSGGTYRYDGVPPNVAKALGRNKSVGKTINKMVKGPGYTYEKVAEGRIEFMKEVMESPLMDYMADEIVDAGIKAAVHKIVEPTPEPPKRHRRHHRGGSWNGTKNHWSKQASSVIEYFTSSRRWATKLAGVAKKQMTVFGLTVKVEHEPGDVRSGTSKDGKTWERKMYASYGYVPGTKGMGDDGDAIDVYVAEDPQDGPVFEVDQEKKDGGHDEMKYMVGYPDMESAKADYMRHMPEWAFGSIKEVAASARDFAEHFK